MALVLWTGAPYAAVQRLVDSCLPRTCDWTTWDGSGPWAPAGDGLPKVDPDDVVLAMGTAALRVLQAAGLVAKGRSIGSVREQPIELPSKAQLLVTYDPDVVDVEIKLLADLQCDLRLAHRLLTTGTTTPQLGRYEWVTSFKPVFEEVDAEWRRTGKPVPVEHDIEYTGDAFGKGRSLTSQFCVHPGHVYIMKFGPKGPTKKQLAEHRRIFTDKRVSIGGASYKSDVLWMMRHWGLRPTNYKFDHVLVGSLLNENRSNSLNMLAKTYTDLGGYDDAFNRRWDKSRMDVPLEQAPDEFRDYACGDPDAGARMRPILRNQLVKDAALARFYTKLLHRANRAFERVENRGVLVDLEAYRKLADELGTKDGDTGYIADKRREFLELLPPRVLAKYRDNPSPTRPNLISDAFFDASSSWTGGSKAGLRLKPIKWIANVDRKTQLPVPSTSSKHLARFWHVEKARPLIQCLADYNAACKTRDTYVDGFLEHLKPDSRFHPFYFLFKGVLDDNDEEGGANTGRTSCKNPAWQTLPKHTKWAKKLRACYPAPPGHVILSWDFSQGELRIAACLANERTMLDAYTRGLDLHVLTAARLSGLSYEDMLLLGKTDPARYDALRSRAKAGNFGLLYGMGVEGFIEYARNAYGVVLTYNEAETIRDTFFATYTGLEPWYQVQHQLAERYGMVRSPLGRVRHLPMIYSRDRATRSKAYRQAVNSVVQGTLSDLCLWAIAEVEEQHPEAEIIIGMTHDNILGYAPIEQAPFWAREVKRVMETLPITETFGWKPQIAFPVDCEMSTTTMAELKKFAPEALAE